eukprot:233394-Prymnesium_polylepis.1
MAPTARRRRRSSSLRRSRCARRQCDAAASDRADRGSTALCSRSQWRPCVRFARVRLRCGRTRCTGRRGWCRCKAVKVARPCPAVRKAVTPAMPPSVRMCSGASLTSSTKNAGLLSR